MAASEIDGGVGAFLTGGGTIGFFGWDGRYVLAYGDAMAFSYEQVSDSRCFGDRHRAPAVLDTE